MCIFPTSPRMLARKNAFSLPELFIVLTIIAVLASIAFIPKHYELDKIARDSLRLAWQAEKDFFAFSYKGSENMMSGSAETYTSDWNELFCKDLNVRDKHFSYTIEEAGAATLRIKAINKRRPGHYFIIDENGKLTDEKGRVYIFNDKGKEQIQ